MYLVTCCLQEDKFLAQWGFYPLFIWNTVGCYKRKLVVNSCGYTTEYLWQNFKCFMVCVYVCINIYVYICRY